MYAPLAGNCKNDAYNSRSDDGVDESVAVKSRSQVVQKVTGGKTNEQPAAEEQCQLPWTEASEWNRMPLGGAEKKKSKSINAKDETKN